MPRPGVAAALTAGAALAASVAWLVLGRSPAEAPTLRSTPAPVDSTAKSGGLQDAVWTDPSSGRVGWQQVASRALAADLRLEVLAIREVTTAVVDGATVHANRERVRWLLNGGEVWTHVFSVSAPAQKPLCMRLWAECHDPGKGVLWLVWAEDVGVWVGALQVVGPGGTPSGSAMRTCVSDRWMGHQIEGAALEVTDGVVRVAVDRAKRRRHTADVSIREGRVVVSNAVDTER